MIAEHCNKTQALLRNHSWRVTLGYARTNIDGSSKNWHQLFLNYEDGLVADHINHKTFDNRHSNLRIVTVQQNNRNLSKRFDNTSGKQGVNLTKIQGVSYWLARIMDDNGKRIQKHFSIVKLGDAEAKRQAISKRIELELLYGYIGD